MLKSPTGRGDGEDMRGGKIVWEETEGEMIIRWGWYEEEVGRRLARDEEDGEMGKMRGVFWCYKVFWNFEQWHKQNMSIV